MVCSDVASFPGHAVRGDSQGGGGGGGVYSNFRRKASGYRIRSNKRATKKIIHYREWYSFRERKLTNTRSGASQIERLVVQLPFEGCLRYKFCICKNLMCHQKKFTLIILLLY